MERVWCDDNRPKARILVEMSSLMARSCFEHRLPACRIGRGKQSERARPVSLERIHSRGEALNRLILEASKDTSHGSKRVDWMNAAVLKMISIRLVTSFLLVRLMRYWV
jgi:hypothetical protein